LYVSARLNYRME